MAEDFLKKITSLLIFWWRSWAESQQLGYLCSMSWIFRNQNEKGWSVYLHHVGLISNNQLQTFVIHREPVPAIWNWCLYVQKIQWIRIHICLSPSSNYSTRIWNDEKCFTSMNWNCPGIEYLYGFKFFLTPSHFYDTNLTCLSEDITCFWDLKLENEMKCLLMFRMGISAAQIRIGRSKCFYQFVYPLRICLIKSLWVFVKVCFAVWA